MSVWRAGTSTDWTQPMAKDTSTRYQTVIQPASSGIPSASDPAACSDWVAITTRAARRRPTMIPARRLNSSIGRN